MADGRGAPASRAHTVRTAWRKFLSLNGSGVFLALLAFVVVIAVVAPLVTDGSQFFTYSNIIKVLRQQTYIGIMACGVTLVMITGHIDLSVGAINTLLAGVCAYTVQFGTLPALAVAIGVGALCGLINGVLVGALKLNSFIATLGTGSVFAALAVIFCNKVSGGYITPTKNAVFEFIGRGSIGVVPMPVVILAIVAVACGVLLSRTAYGQRLYAIGANRRTARYSGVHTGRCIAITFVITGALCGLSAAVMVSNIMSASPTVSSGKEMDVILAVVLGGTSIMGGKGSILGTVLGFCFIGFVSTGFTFLSINTYLQWVIMGVILITALYLDVRKEGAGRPWRRSE